jgi:hypothetical protein
MSAPADLNGLTTSAQLVAPYRLAVGTGTQTFAGIDLLGYINNLKLCISHKEFSTSGVHSVQYSLLDSADNTTFAASAGLPTIAANTAASALIDVALDTRACKRYLQLKALTASTTATFDLSAVAIGVKQVS